uniref:Cytochrome f n=1 Tax=Sporolithon durum TaxID=48970 RepID=A0A141SCS1_9FLOR|nr:cytochrome f [Sporolithon durum]AMK96089.1 cytochrome f [Sporolithon durum]
MNLEYLYNIGRKSIALILAIAVMINFVLICPYHLQAFPIYAQQSYEDPREPTGRIVCANCHLAQKPITIEAPQSVLPNTIFETIVKIPYNTKSQQILGNGQKGPLNVGAIVILPEGFKLAPSNLVSNEIKEKNKRVYIQPYSTAKDNILVVGPISGEQNQEITFPILSPDPSKNKNVHFLKYPIYVGANKGRGQLYPTGDKSNNNIITSSTSGTVIDINTTEQGGYSIQIKKTNGDYILENVPKGLNLDIYKGQNIITNQALTKDPNVGGFGQNETEIVLQSPDRIKGMITFFFIITIAQIFFVLKKKQWEKVQAADMNF